MGETDQVSREDLRRQGTAQLPAHSPARTAGHAAGCSRCSAVGGWGGGTRPAPREACRSARAPLSRTASRRALWARERAGNGRQERLCASGSGRSAGTSEASPGPGVGVL